MSFRKERDEKKEKKSKSSWFARKGSQSKLEKSGMEKSPSVGSTIFPKSMKGIQRAISVPDFKKEQKTEKERKAKKTGLNLFSKNKKLDDKSMDEKVIEFRLKLQNREGFLSLTEDEVIWPALTILSQKLLLSENVDFIDAYQNRTSDAALYAEFDKKIDELNIDEYKQQWRDLKKDQLNTPLSSALFEKIYFRIADLLREDLANRLTLGPGLLENLRAAMTETPHTKKGF